VLAIRAQSQKNLAHALNPHSAGPPMPAI